MKTEEELNRDIVRITQKIADTYPELTKFINEIPVKITGSYGSKITKKNLIEYCSSLEDILNDYSKTHPAQNNKNAKHT